MYIKYTISTRRTLKYAWWLLLLTVVYTYLIYLMSDRFTLGIPPAIPAVLATAVSLLLGFRTNSAYNRWWEARKNWGGIIAYSRTFSRQVKSYIPKDYVNYKRVVKRLIYLQLAFVYAHRNALRHSGSREDYEKFMDPSDINRTRTYDNVPVGILNIQASILGELHSEGMIEAVTMANMDRTLKNITLSMGGNERIKNTVFPVQYSVFTRAAIFIYAVLFPFGIISQEAIGMIVLTFSVVFFFIIIDAIGSYLKDPFENKNSDIPISSLARSIEIDLLELMEEKDIPPKLIMKNGVLM
jgi:putative membrane protein